MNTDHTQFLATEHLPGALDTISWDYRQAIAYGKANCCPTEARRLLAKRRAVYRRALDLVLAQAEWALCRRPETGEDAERAAEEV